MQRKSQKIIPIPGVTRGLSGKLLSLIVAFIMLGEILIFLPSIANFRLQWLEARMALAETAMLAVTAAGDKPLPAPLRVELLQSAGVLGVSQVQDFQSQALFLPDASTQVAQFYDLRHFTWYGAIGDALSCLFASSNRIISVTDGPHRQSVQSLTIVVNEGELRRAMRHYGLNIFLLSVLLSFLVAIMVFAVLNWLLVKPMRRLTCNMVLFSDAPDDFSRIIQPSARGDEVGVAERELHNMQRELALLLQQKNHLAALGLAVSKVSHDLRNMLTSAQLISDRLASSEDPTVKKLTPKLVNSLDRAIDFLSQTLKFGRAQESAPQRQVFAVRPLTVDVLEQAALLTTARTQLTNHIPDDLTIDADREQLFRALSNLARNAVQALEAAYSEGATRADGKITLKGWREDRVTYLTITDNGPGIAPHIRERLFEAFQTAARSGGTGLGLTIAYELIRAHGGELVLQTQTTDGTAFLIKIPDRES